MKPQTSKQSVKQTPVIALGDRTQEPLVASSTGQNKPLMSDELHARIAARAYELYVQHGCREGRTVEDWLQAEREILTRVVSV